MTSDLPSRSVSSSIRTVITLPWSVRWSRSDIVQVPETTRFGLTVSPLLLAATDTRPKIGGRLVVGGLVWVVGGVVRGDEEPGVVVGGSGSVVVGGLGLVVVGGLAASSSAALARLVVGGLAGLVVGTGVVICAVDGCAVGGVDPRGTVMVGSRGGNRRR